MTEPTYHCPECDSDQVTSEQRQMFMVNTGEHYCHNVKAHDFNSRSTCLDCDWEGYYYELREEAQ